MTFWDHLDELRKSLTYPVIVLVVLTMVAFTLKKPLFDVVLAANSWDFVTYRMIPGDDKHSSKTTATLPVTQVGVLPADGVGVPGAQSAPDTSGAFVATVAAVLPEKATSEEMHHPGQLVQLISTELPAQLMVSMKVSFYVALVLTIPYLLFRLYRFAMPALYEKERKYSGRVLIFSFLSFFIGILVSYFIIFPISLRFLVGYAVSEQVTNMFSVTSYVNMLMTLSVLMGLCFELPILSWVLAIFGVLKAALLVKYRKHAFVGILVIAAIITPTTDVFTLMLVSLPISLLYELSVLIVKMTERRRNKRLKLEAASN